MGARRLPLAICAAPPRCRPAAPPLPFAAANPPRRAARLASTPLRRRNSAPPRRRRAAMKQRKGGGDEGTGRLETGRDGKTEERERRQWWGDIFTCAWAPLIDGVDRELECLRSTVETASCL